MGISGGLDSSYLAYLGYKWGLKILAVHVDDGYDTEVSKTNIQKLCDAAHIELRVIRPDSEQYNQLTLAYMKAGVPNLAIPQDNILLAFLYDTMIKEKIKYFLSGGNFALECILQKGNTHSSSDNVNTKDIFKRFGKGKINKLKFISSSKILWLKNRGRAVEIRPLNFIDYNRERAFKELSDFCGFQYYGRKHLENKLTSFVQLFWLPKKFGVDKRTSHLSSMIVSGQMSKEDAILELKEPLYEQSMMLSYIDEIKSKMHISDEEFNAIMGAPTHQHCEYKVDRMPQIINSLVRIRKCFK